MKKPNQNNGGNTNAGKTPAADSKASTGNGDSATTTEDAGDGDGEGDKPKETEVAKDPFADLPTVKLHEVEVTDLCGVETSNPRKYAKVHEAAVAERMPVLKGWKHERAMFVPGSARKELKPGSVHGDIQAIVAANSRTGISAVDLVTQLRMRQVGNKRSHYCDKLPPVGWAEGWINSAVTRNIIGVSATKRAPALRPEETAAAGDKGEGKPEDKGQDRKAA